MLWGSFDSRYRGPTPHSCVHTHPDHGDASDCSRPNRYFPNINIPVISIIRNYNSLVPEDMSDRVDTRSRVNSSPPPALPAHP
jgi:hypothetical protein